MKKSKSQRKHIKRRSVRTQKAGVVICKGMSKTSCDNNSSKCKWTYSNGCYPRYPGGQ